jgi:hypothetical protein
MTLHRIELADRSEREFYERLVGMWGGMIFVGAFLIDLRGSGLGECPLYVIYSWL